MNFGRGIKFSVFILLAVIPEVKKEKLDRSSKRFFGGTIREPTGDRSSSLALTPSALFRHRRKINLSMGRFQRFLKSFCVAPAAKSF